MQRRKTAVRVSLPLAILTSAFCLLPSAFPQDVPEIARTLLEEADRARETNRVDDAIAKYRRVIEVAPNLASAWANLGALYFGQGKIDDAYRTFIAGVKNAPADRTLLSNAAATAQQLGKSAEALTYVDRALDTNRKDPALYAIRGTILRSLGRNGEALNALQEAATLDPADAKVQFSLGNLLFQLGRKQDAIVSYQHAVDLDRSMLRAWYNLGAALFETGAYDQALGAYRMALAPIEQSFAKGEKVDPIHARAYANLGAIYLKQQQWQPAIDAYEKALRLQPNDTAAHYNLGFLFFTTGKTDRAEEEYRKALAADASLPLAYLQLGEIAYRRGDYDQALREFRDGMRLFDNEQKAAALQLEARIAVKRSDVASAEAALSQLTSDSRDVVLDREALIVLLLKQNDLAAARKQIDALPNAPELATIRAALSGQADIRGDSPLANADAGLLAWQKGQLAEARPLLAAAHQAFPTWAAVTLANGEIALADHRLDDAVALLTSTCDTTFTPTVRNDTLVIATGSDGNVCTRMQQSASTAFLMQAADELDRAVRRQDETAARRARQLAERAAGPAAIVQYVRGVAELVGGSESTAREALNRAISLGLPSALEAAARKNLEAMQPMPEPVIDVKPEPTSPQPRHTVVVFLPDAPADEKQVAASMSSLFAQVSSASGVPLQTEFFRRADDARNFIAANRERVGIVVSNGEMLASDLTPHFRLTNNGRESYRRVVVVPAKSAIKSLDDLRGRTVSSVEGLRDLGAGTPVHVTDDFTAVANALYGKSDAAYVSEANALLAQRARDLRIIHTSAPQAMPAVAFAPMPLADRTALDNALAATGSLARVAQEQPKPRVETKKIEIATAPIVVKLPADPPPVALRVEVPLPKITLE